MTWVVIGASNRVREVTVEVVRVIRQQGGRGGAWARGKWRLGVGVYGDSDARGMGWVCELLGTGDRGGSDCG